ncbi:SH3 domain-containing protein [Lentzea sp. NPDC005914]|uniref:SH3 domain-containing protein n=1 Tax=Lentzea sp. NPDC005914 TaxID=3154572 RepID=UPI0033DB4827
MRATAKSIMLGACAALVLSLATATGATAGAAVCGGSPWHVGDGRTVRFQSAVTIRSGPSTGCTAVGVIGPGHVVRLDCFVLGAGGRWSHISDLGTGVQGWVRDGQGNPEAEVPC